MTSPWPRPKQRNPLLRSARMLYKKGDAGEKEKKEVIYSLNEHQGKDH